MSVMMLSTAHFDYLVSFAVRAEVRYWSRADKCSERVTATGATALGRVLASANADAWANRYSSHSDEFERGQNFAAARDYRWRPFAGPFDPVQVLKAVACLEYQACEASGWEESDAAAICNAIREYAVAKLPGYDAALWGIDDAADLRAAAAAPASAPVSATAARTARLAAAVPAFTSAAPAAPAAPFYGQGRLI